MALPRSIRWRYSLRALIALLTLAALWCGYYANRGLRERRAIAVLREHGATLGYDRFERRGSAWTSPIRQYQNAVQFMWNEPRVTNVMIASTLPPDIVDALCALPHLQILSLSSHDPNDNTLSPGGTVIRRENLPDGALRRILSKHSLLRLDMTGWKLSEHNCKAIADHRTLSSLSMNNSDFAATSAARLLEMQCVKQIDVFNCNITGNPEGTRQGSPTLNGITCVGTPLGKDFATCISHCPRLSRLTLKHNSINDDFLRLLGLHPAISHIDIAGNITEDSAVTLSTMPSLKSADLWPYTASKHSLDDVTKATLELRRLRPTVLVNGAHYSGL